MSLDGLRAWIGEVERKLGARTRVFWVLVAIAIGGAGAGIYLALKAAEDSASKGEVQALREQVESSAGTPGPAEESAAVATLKAELETLRGQLEELQGKGGSGGTSGKGSAGSGSATEGSQGGAGASSGSAAPGKESSATGGADAGRLKELVEKAKQQAK